MTTATCPHCKASPCEHRTFSCDSNSPPLLAVAADASMGGVAIGKKAERERILKMRIRCQDFDPRKIGNWREQSYAEAIWETGWKAGVAAYRARIKEGDGG